MEPEALKTVEPQPGAARSVGDRGLSSPPTGLPRDPGTDVPPVLLTHCDLGGRLPMVAHVTASDTDRKLHLRKKDLGSGALGDLTWVTWPRGA